MICNGRLLTCRSRPPIVGMATEKLKAHGTSYGLVEAGYDIRIKQDIHFQMNGSQGMIFVDNHPNWNHGRFTLASAIEEFDMPNDLVGVVHDKSTWARRGLSVFNTVIEPGWKGFLTLELVFHGQEPVHIPAGSGIAQVIFHYIQDSERPYEGKYQNQIDEPVPAKKG